MPMEQRKPKGEELLIEASSLLFEEIEKIADEISPEEASEFEELRRTIIERYI